MAHVRIAECHVRIAESAECHVRIAECHVCITECHVLILAVITRHSSMAVTLNLMNVTKKSVKEVAIGYDATLAQGLSDR